MNNFNFNLELAKTIINLEVQKETLISENKIKERLCPCRLKLFDQYVKVSQALVVRFTGKVIKFLEDYNKELTRFDDLENWYYTNMYDNLLKKETIEIKTILLLRLLQDKFDANFFKTTDIKFKKIIAEFDPSKENCKFKTIINEIYSDIQDWIEIHILGLLSIQLNCEHINDSIITDNSDKILVYSDAECLASESYNLTEAIRLYLTNETIEDGSPCDYLNLITHYHTDVSNINLILDFCLIEEMITIKPFMINIFERTLARSEFKSVSIANYEKVDFGKYLELAKPYLDRPKL